jgi:hypothetical protein
MSGEAMVAWSFGIGIALAMIILSLIDHGVCP